VKFPIDVDKRIDGGAAVGAHKTSMLQDLERGRPMEIDALVTAVHRTRPRDRRGDAHDRHGARPRAVQNNGRTAGRSATPPGAVCP
jgi:hypothetical protein